MLAHSSEGIIVAAANDPEFPVVYANPAYERLTGASADELRGQCLPLLSGSDLDEKETEQLKAALIRGGFYVTHLAGRHEDGTDSVSQVRAEPLYGPRGEGHYIMVSQTPVSAARQRAEAVQASKLACCSGKFDVYGRNLRRWIDWTRAPACSATNTSWN